MTTAAAQINVRLDANLKLIDQGSELFITACRESGIDLAKAQPSGDEELKRNAYADRCGEEMGWLYE